MQIKSLKSRISELQSQAGAHPAPAARTAAESSLRERLSHLRSDRVAGFSVHAEQRMSKEELARRLNGTWIADGLLKIEELLSIADLPGSPIPAESMITPLLPGEEVPLPSIYIDTETTGLSGGSGTIAFLVGLAEMTDDSIQLNQFLITSFSAEAALLSAILEKLTSSHRLVSYNGKSYDIPLLATRLRMQGLQVPIAEREHLDLLHPIRRLFQKHWEDCRLITAEKRLLNFARQNDLPGAEAPAAWFAYMQRQEGEKLVRVVEHNRQDILSLAAIHHAISRAITSPATVGADLHGLGRWLLDIDEPRALSLLSAHQSRLCDDGKRLLGYLFRRAERWDEALSIWEELATRNCVNSIERLAKYHEHVSQDLHAALHYCTRLPGSAQDTHRRERVKKKLENSPGSCALRGLEETRNGF